MNKGKLANRNKGFALATALLIITALGAILTGVVYSTTSVNDRREAEVAGWEAVQVGRAARLWVRNQIENVTPAMLAASPATTSREFVALAVAANPEISLDVLIAQNYLPANFARRDGAGNYFNALGQEIRVIAGNYPVNGNTALDTTVPTAYVYMVENPADPRSNAELAQIVVQGARNESTPVSAPLFSGGANLSGACATTNPANTGGLTAVIWDSGCLDYAEFTALTGDAFQPGSLVIPAWRTVNFDTRAIMRFPQPEQTALQTMRVDLEMADMLDCSIPGNEIVITDDTGTTTTTICDSAIDVPNPNPALAVDARRSFLNVNNLQAANLIVHPQANNDVARNGAVAGDAANDFVIGGDLTGEGDAKVYNGVTTVNDTVIADKNIVVSGSGVGPAASTVAGSLVAGNAALDDLTVRNTANIDAEVSVDSFLTDVNDMSADNNIIAQTLSTDNNMNINVANNANIIQPDTTNPVAINNLVTTGGTSLPSSTYSVALARVRIANDVRFTRDVTVQNDADVDGRLITNITSATNSGGTAQCVGDCPLRTIRDQCASLAPVTGESVSDCINRQRP